MKKRRVGIKFKLLYLKYLVIAMLLILRIEFLQVQIVFVLPRNRLNMSRQTQAELGAIADITSGFHFLAMVQSNELSLRCFHFFRISCKNNQNWDIVLSLTRLISSHSSEYDKFD